MNYFSLASKKICYLIFFSKKMKIELFWDNFLEIRGWDKLNVSIEINMIKAIYLQFTLIIANSQGTICFFMVVLTHSHFVRLRYPPLLQIISRSLSARLKRWSAENPKIWWWVCDEFFFAKIDIGWQEWVGILEKLGEIWVKRPIKSIILSFF